MNWIDKVVGYVSPHAGAKREAWRQYTEELRRNYDAGNRDRINSNWRAFNESAEMTDRGYRDTIRARARDLERNSDMMNSVTGAFKRNVIGGGYKLQVKTEDEDLNRLIEKAWKKWCKKENCDITGMQSFNQMIRMLHERKKVDGGILIKKCYTKGGYLPFKLQVLEVDELDISQVKPKIEGNRVIGGIEVDSFNKPVGYWIKQYTLDGFSVSNAVFVEAKNIIYYFSKKRPSQVREVSDMTQTLTRIRDTNEFMTAVSVKERIAACMAVFIKKALPSTGTLGRDSSAGGQNSRVSYAGKSLAPGMISELNQGDEIQTVTPPGQSNDSAAHVKLQQRLIGSGQGLSYEATARDMSETNYSSARQSGIEDGLTYAEEKELLKEVMDEIYETFVISGVLAGEFQIKDFWSTKDDYFQHEWIQAPKPWIDPVKESNANRIALQTGQKTFKQIAAENGKDWQEQIDEIEEVLNYGRKKGIELGGVIFGENYGKLNEE